MAISREPLKFLLPKHIAGFVEWGPNNIFFIWWKWAHQIYSVLIDTPQYQSAHEIWCAYLLDSKDVIEAPKN